MAEFGGITNQIHQSGNNKNEHRCVNIFHNYGSMLVHIYIILFSNSNGT